MVWCRSGSPGRRGEWCGPWGVIANLKPHRFWRRQRSGRVLTPNANAKNVRGAGAPRRRRRRARGSRATRGRDATPSTPTSAALLARSVPSCAASVTLLCSLLSRCEAQPSGSLRPHPPTPLLSPWLKEDRPPHLGLGTPGSLRASLCFPDVELVVKGVPLPAQRISSTRGRPLVP